jgi:hypothetical protein
MAIIAYIHIVPVQAQMNQEYGTKSRQPSKRRRKSFDWYLVIQAVGTNLQTWKANGSVLLREWLYVPIGVVIMLLFIMGVNLLISLSGITFPASVNQLFNWVD